MFSSNLGGLQFGLEGLDMNSFRWRGQSAQVFGRFGYDHGHRDQPPRVTQKKLRNIPARARHEHRRLCNNVPHDRCTQSSRMLLWWSLPLRAFSMRSLYKAFAHGNFNPVSMKEACSGSGNTNPSISIGFLNVYAVFPNVVILGWSG